MSTFIRSHIEFSLKKHFEGAQSCSHKVKQGFKSNFSHCSALLCIHLCFHSCIHSDAQCHLKLNSEENQYDKLLLVLSLNCFTLEIDTGARAIHHRLREVGAPRENSWASMWSRKKENAMGVSVGWVKTEVSSWQAGGEIRNKDEEQEKRRVMLCFSILPPSLSLRGMDDV